MKETLKIEGMTCDHCAMKVTNALESVEGVKKAKVSLKKKEAIVDFDGEVSKEAMVEAVSTLGYKAM